MEEEMYRSGRSELIKALHGESIEEISLRNRELLGKPIALETTVPLSIYESDFGGGDEGGSLLEAFSNALAMYATSHDRSKVVDAEEALRVFFSAILRGVPQIVGVYHSPSCFQDFFMTSRSVGYFYYCGKVELGASWDDLPEDGEEDERRKRK